MIDRKKNVTGPLQVKIHYDNQKRVFTRFNKYFYGPINKTPFAFGIAIPQPYGAFRVKSSTDINPNFKFDKNDKKWTIHPDWVYCECLYSENCQFKTREEELSEHIQSSKREEKMPRVKDPLPWDKKYPVNPKDDTRTKNEYYCDRELINNLIFDAIMTSAFGKTRSIPTDIQEQNNPLRLLLALIN
uniref:Uncharacterized protein n=1 Tax=Strigamia maritima TaxID=126957 RepID=T1II76_STRMM